MSLISVFDPFNNNIDPPLRPLHLAIMATSRDAPNPLRPYYIPPSIGPPPDQLASSSSVTSRPSYPSSSKKASFGSTARDYLSDIDYGDYLSDSSPSLAEMAKKLMDQALWSYTTVLLAQPFEVAKTILQVHMASSQDPATTAVASANEGEKSRPSSYASGKFQDYPSDEDDSDADSPSYFTSTAPTSSSHSRSPERSRQQLHNRSHSSTPTPGSTNLRTSNKLELKKNDSLFEVLSQLWQKESVFGVWRGTNATFVYNFLLKTIESWTRSMLSALLNVPDPGLHGSFGSGIGGLDVVDSPNPFFSLAVAVAAAGVAGFVLAPLDLIKTRIILTPSSVTPRRIVQSLMSLPSLSLPTSILPITLLHSTLPTLFSASTPMFLRSMLSIDPVLTPSAYSISTFLSSSAELFLRLPLETVLRRGQVQVLRDGEHERERLHYVEMRRQRDGSEKFKTLVETGPYKGVLGTMWFIAREEGITVTGPRGATSSQGYNRAFGRMKKGQGVTGLWRGWRVGFWGIVGVWGAAAFGSNAGGEF
ncbi:mitochondrial carrier [Pseudovirgaria hyperparasitica]|uniref:Mitochondrial carrier n=1 Tax=Pseudovirgaria hyperparasitica TaxID=470096 RepID=A0A6A6VY90_9PEZI|nr:mitochondrial carrier [Pseudovirgaria hyperparasitica]KAF2754674.1 mitochondrial carrier [Pseudovirgaria hyperparasitica]